MCSRETTIQVKVKFLQPDQYIRPDMNARVTFLEPGGKPKQESEERLLAIPKRAVLDRDSGKVVYIVSEGKVEAKPIVVRKEVGTDVFVSAGLLGNEAIIVGEQVQQLKVGDPVAVR